VCQKFRLSEGTAWVLILWAKFWKIKRGGWVTDKSLPRGYGHFLKNSENTENIPRFVQPTCKTIIIITIIIIMIIIIIIIISRQALVQLYIAKFRPRLQMAGALWWSSGGCFLES